MKPVTILSILVGMSWLLSASAEELDVRRDDRLRASKFEIVDPAQKVLARGTVWIADNGDHEFVIGEQRVLTAEQVRQVHERLAASIASTDEPTDPEAVLSLRKAKVLHTLLSAMIEAAGERKGTITVPPGLDTALPLNHPMLGVNLEGVSYWSRAWTFTDVMKQASFHRGNFMVYVDSQGHFPRGRYTVMPAHAATVSGPERLDSKHVKITRHGGGNDPDFSVYLPGFAPGEPGEGQTFHPLFRQWLKPFGTLRFLDWQKTNANPPATWDQRPRPGPLQSDSRGVAVEYMIELCNDLDADLWVCIPHHADDDYNRQFARLVRSQLEPQLKVFVEYSNEVWNSIFPQYKWVKERAEAADRHLYEQVAIEAGRDWDIWLEEFGEQGDRVVRVLAGQSANRWHLEVATKQLGPDGFDAVAIAAYIGISRKDAEAWFDDQVTADQVLDRLFWKLENKDRARWAGHAELARKYGVPLLAYEGGQHLTTHGRRPPYLKAFQRAQSHPRMYDLYREMFDTWFEAGGSTFVAYAYTGPNNHNGAWGKLQFQDQDIGTAPKYRAMIEAVGQKPTGGDASQP